MCPLLRSHYTSSSCFRCLGTRHTRPFGANLTVGDKPSTWICQNATPGGSTDYAALSEKSSKIFCCPASPSARRTASWKSLNEYRTIAGGVSALFDIIVRRSVVAARTSPRGWELTQRGSHHPRTVAVE